MSTSVSSQTSAKPAAWLSWFPLLVIALAAAAVAVLWLLPTDLEDLWRRVGTYAAVGLGVILLMGWVAFLAPWSGRTRLSILAAVALLAGAAAATLEMDDSGVGGNIELRLRWRSWVPWARSRDDDLERHRQGLGTATAAADEEFSGRGEHDYPEYRGRKRDGVVTGPTLSRSWPEGGPPRVWPKEPPQPVGLGHSSFAVAAGAAVTLEQRRDQEAVVCYDLPTGKERWKYTYPALFHETLGGKGPRSTPTIADGDVYALGATGQLVCLDARTGQHRWTADVLKDNTNVKWGMTGSPLVVDKVVVVNAGTQTAQAPGTLHAYDRKTGNRVWASGQGEAGYSSPMLMTLAGKPQIVLFDGEGIAGYDPAEKGKQLWRHPWKTQENINVAQPVQLEGDRIFVSSGYGVGCAMLRVKEQGGAWNVEVVWKNRNMRCRFTSPVLHKGFLYGLDEGWLACLDPQTGERKWREGQHGQGQVLLSGDLLVIQAESGEVVLVEPAPQEYRELGRFQAIRGRSWNLPALAGGLLLVRNHQEMACYDLRAGAR